MKDEEQGIGYRLMLLERTQDDMGSVLERNTKAVDELIGILKSIQHVVTFIIFIAKMVAAVTVILGAITALLLYAKGLIGVHKP